MRVELGLTSAKVKHAALVGLKQKVPVKLAKPRPAKHGVTVMKTSSRFVSTASLAICLVTAAASTALAQGMQGGMGPGMMGGGMMQGGMGQGMMCPMMSGMMQGGMGPGMMSPGMMGRGMMGQGMGSRMTRGGMFGSRVTPMMNLSVDDVRSYLDMQIERLNNKRLKISNVSADDGVISAEVVTVDNSLVQRLKVDRHTGAIEYEN